MSTISLFVKVLLTIVFALYFLSIVIPSLWKFKDIEDYKPKELVVPDSAPVLRISDEETEWDFVQYAERPTPPLTSLNSKLKLEINESNL